MGIVTSHDVARLAGVSQPTVSRALRDSPKVSADTKERVRRAADALGYVPSETGRALSSGRTRRVGLLLTDLENQFYPHVISPIHHELESLGYQLVLQTESSDTGSVAERLIANSLDGVLLATTTSTSLLPLRLRDRRIPFVYFNRTTDAVEADSATVDPEQGITELVDEIVRLGHRRVGAIFGPPNTSTAEQRERALRAALETHDLTIPNAAHGAGSVRFRDRLRRNHEAARTRRAADRHRVRQRRRRPRRPERRPRAGRRRSGSGVTRRVRRSSGRQLGIGTADDGQVRSRRDGAACGQPVGRPDRRRP